MISASNENSNDAASREGGINQNEDTTAMVTSNSGGSNGATTDTSSASSGGGTPQRRAARAAARQARNQRLTPVTQGPTLDTQSADNYSGRDLMSSLNGDEDVGVDSSKRNNNKEGRDINDEMAKENEKMASSHATMTPGAVAVGISDGNKGIATRAAPPSTTKPGAVPDSKADAAAASSLSATLLSPAPFAAKPGAVPSGGVSPAVAAATRPGAVAVSGETNPTSSIGISQGGNVSGGQEVYCRGGGLSLDQTVSEDYETSSTIVAATQRQQQQQLLGQEGDKQHNATTDDDKIGLTTTRDGIGNRVGGLPGAHAITNLNNTHGSSPSLQVQDWSW